MKHKDWQRTILAQYANREIMLKILHGINVTVDPYKDIDGIFVNELDLDTCGTHGLDVWGVIVAAPRTIIVRDDDYFGFWGTELKPFDEGPFWNGKKGYYAHRLENSAYRKLIYFKGMANIMKTTIPRMNELLRFYFEGREGAWDAYVQNTGVMTMRVVLRMTLTPVERAIFATYGHWIRPAGVGMSIREIPYETWGFNEGKLRPWNDGTYYNGAIWLTEEYPMGRNVYV